MGRIIAGVAAAPLPRAAKSAPATQPQGNELWFEGGEPVGGIDPNREVLKVRIVWRDFDTREFLSNDDARMTGQETTGYVYAEPLEMRRKFLLPRYRPMAFNWREYSPGEHIPGGEIQQPEVRQSWLRLQQNWVVLRDLDGPRSPVYVEDA